jgi:hypothetical protein
MFLKRHVLDFSSPFNVILSELFGDFCPVKSVDQSCSFLSAHEATFIVVSEKIYKHI